MKVSATKIFQFHMAHKLEEAYTEECKNIHGHTYKLEVTVTCTGLDSMGMICDFKLLKEAVEPVIKEYDHKYITQETFGVNPTAEHMALRLFQQVQEKLDEADWKKGSCLTLMKIRLWETSSAYVDVDR